MKKEIKDLDFDQIVLKYSNQKLNFSTSDLDWISSDSLDPQINKLISKLKVGQISKPIKDKIV